MHGTKRWTLGFLIVLPFVLATADAGAAGFIRLENVPETLHLPAPAGQNRILTADVEGEPVRSVWLGTDLAASGQVMLTRVDQTQYQINLYSHDVLELLRQRRPGGEFRIFAKTETGAVLSSLPVSFAIDLPPDRLDFPGEMTSVTIDQRRSKPVPGSDDRLRIWLGDITYGQVHLSVIGPGNRALIDAVSLHMGDTVELPLAAETYVIRVDQLVNYLVGNDQAVLTIMPIGIWNRQNIDFLFNAIESWDGGFIRNGSEHSGQEAADHLRRKLDAARGEVKTADQFIELIATRSSLSGDPYQVRMPDGSTVEMATWLRALLAARRNAGSTSTPEPVASRNQAPTSKP